jgi:hypothetical protein
MALTITATVSKKVGKPNYGSEGFTLTVQSEVTNLDQVKEESHRLYLLLSDSVSQELAGSSTDTAPKNAEWPKIVRNASPDWKCSEKQRDLILRVMEDNGVNQGDVESISLEMFGNSDLKSLNKLQASGIIDEMLNRWGKKSSRGTGSGGRFGSSTGRFK